MPVPPTRRYSPEAVRAARRATPLTQEHVARLLGVKRQQITEWETGFYYAMIAGRSTRRAIVHPERLADLAAALDVPYESLLLPDEDEQ